MIEHAKTLMESIKAQENSAQAKFLSRYFKTSKGEYGYGDIFLGLRVPQVRKEAKPYTWIATKLGEESERKEAAEAILLLFSSKIHECRFAALCLLTEATKIAIKEKNEKLQKTLLDFYLKHTQYVNNWDLVDLTSKMIGLWVDEHPNDEKIITTLSKSTNMWEQRMSLIGCHPLIKKAKFKLFVSVAESLLSHEHDLIHKAVGWMLREMGKVDKKALDGFLNKHIKTIQRTSLRYAVEKHSQSERNKFYALNDDGKGRKARKRKTKEESSESSEDNVEGKETEKETKKPTRKGRTRKVKEELSEESEKETEKETPKKRGRKMKIKEEKSESIDEKEKENEKETPKKRGRPRKAKEERRELSEESEKETKIETPTKRGRKMKIKEERSESIEQEKETPKKRGRPRKVKEERRELSEESEKETKIETPTKRGRKMKIKEERSENIEKERKVTKRGRKDNEESYEEAKRIKEE